MAGVAYIRSISFAILVLLAIVYFSYRQTIVAYTPPTFLLQLVETWVGTMEMV
jgi:hypothetical protein